MPDSEWPVQRVEFDVGLPAADGHTEAATPLRTHCAHAVHEFPPGRGGCVGRSVQRNEPFSNERPLCWTPRPLSDVGKIVVFRETEQKHAFALALVC